MANKACWAMAAMRTRKRGEGVGVSSGIVIGFWDGRKWVKNPVSVACGSPVQAQTRALAMFKGDALLKGASSYSPVPMKMLIKLPSGNYDIHPEHSADGRKTDPSYELKA
jgi:hypothetical protein